MNVHKHPILSEISDTLSYVEGLGSSPLLKHLVDKLNNIGNSVETMMENTITHIETLGHSAHFDPSGHLLAGVKPPPTVTEVVSEDSLISPPNA